MKRRRRIRFGLSSLLAIVTLAAAGLGYLRWTRGVLTATCEELAADGVDVTFEETGPRWLRRTIDSDFWLRKAVKAEVTVVQVGVSLFNVAGRNLGPGESQQALRGIAERLRRIGVKEISLEVMPAPSYWHEPRASHAEDRARQVAGDKQKRQLETYAAANGFVDKTAVIVMGGGAPMAAPAAGSPVGN